MNRAPLDYDAADDGVRSYYAAIEHKRLRGDDYYLRQPDDPGVDDVEPAARPFNWRLIIALAAIEVAAIGVFTWVVWR
ncbi:MAG: hypothetical protein M9945_12525 [Aquamicrobium sp.]|uniref:hypothetical protein n=1 Tax=Aquamicrobium sp. TaxID=1872579 RepID=UPI00349E879B|nr:hypothetical protein [Aquamicrobium sp.]